VKILNNTTTGSDVALHRRVMEDYILSELHADTCSYVLDDDDCETETLNSNIATTNSGK
jgi:hypothetical protein